MVKIIVIWLALYIRDIILRCNYVYIACCASLAGM